ncbi:MAG: hypothetical protein FDX30_09995 [Chlorobium sp.]|nr:MAG: hypothetical protein FDX30_09995 [Chlorobium sp.]
MDINKYRFFVIVQKNIAEKTLDQKQKDGFKYLLAKIEGLDLDKRWAAYIIATVWHDTLCAMQPISEKGSLRHFNNYENCNGNIFLGDGFLYRGRGYVPLVWKDNYQKFGRLLGIDLLGDPEVVLNPEIAWKILIAGMTGGLFTGDNLLKYFNDVNTDWIEARKIINNSDDGEQIAEHAIKFYEAL